MEFYVEKTSIPSFVIFMLIIPCILVGVFYYYDPFGLKNHFPRLYPIAILFTIFSLFSLFLFKKQFYPEESSTSSVKPSEYVLKLLLSLGVIIAAFYLGIFIVKQLSKIETVQQFIIFVIKILMIAGAFGIIYLLFKKVLESGDGKSSSGPVSFIQNLIFYIPCLLIQFIDYVKEQYNATTSTIWIILAMEIVLIGLAYLIPIIYNYIGNRDATVLLKDPIYLNKKYSLGTFETLHEQNEDSKIYEYAISGWYYINPQPPSTSSAYTKYTPILDYGNKPIVEYNGTLNSIRVRTDIGDKDIKNVYVSSNVNYQKWTNIVINYDGANIDIFMDGELVSTASNVAPYMKFENLVSGADNGIQGGICNVQFYHKTLSKSNIENSFNLLKNFNPPIL